MSKKEQGKREFKLYNESGGPEDVPLGKINK